MRARAVHRRGASHMAYRQVVWQVIAILLSKSQSFTSTVDDVFFVLYVQETEYKFETIAAADSFIVI